MNTFRENLKNKKRIVVKIGSSSLQHAATGELDYGKMDVFVRQLCDLKNQGKEVVLVTSGAVAAGRKAVGISKKEQEGCCPLLSQSFESKALTSKAAHCTSCIDPPRRDFACRIPRRQYKERATCRISHTGRQTAGDT